MKKLIKILKWGFGIFVVLIIIGIFAEESEVQKKENVITEKEIMKEINFNKLKEKNGIYYEISKKNYKFFRCNDDVTNCNIN